MKKLSIVLLGIFLVLSACTNAGNNNSNNSDNVNNANNTGNSSSNNKANASDAENSTDTNEQGTSAEAGTFPLTDEKETITIMVVQNPLVTDLVDNDFTKWYEEKTNVHVEWQIVQASSKQEKLNLALSSGEYPEVLMNFAVSPSQQMVYGQQGTFLALNDLIDKYGVETKKLMEKYPEVKNAITAPGGNIYALPKIDRNPHTMMIRKMWIYTPWLDELDLETPQTTEQFYQTLKAFKEGDPNGNGMADEIPLAGSYAGGKSLPLEDFIMNAFIMHTPEYLIFDEQGNIDVNFNKQGWKEGLAYMNKLYSEGLIAPESFTQNNAQLKELVENPNIPITGAVRANALGQFVNLKGPRALEYKTVPPLEGPDGYRMYPYDYYKHNGGDFIITDKAKNPELIYRWVDGLMNEDVSVLSNVGLEGVGWEKAGADDKGLAGGPATWKRLIQGGQAHNRSWQLIPPYHYSRELFEGLAAKENEQPYILYNETKNNYEPYKAPVEMIVPPVFFNESQAFEISDLDKTIKDYVKEMMVRFIIGDASLEQGWDEYVKTIDSMNLERYLEIYNEAYAAQYK